MWIKIGCFLAALNQLVEYICNALGFIHMCLGFGILVRTPIVFFQRSHVINLHAPLRGNMCCGWEGVVHEGLCSVFFVPLILSTRSSKSSTLQNQLISIKPPDPIKWNRHQIIPYTFLVIMYFCQLKQFTVASDFNRYVWHWKSWLEMVEEGRVLRWLLSFIHRFWCKPWTHDEAEQTGP